MDIVREFFKEKILRTPPLQLAQEQFQQQLILALTQHNWDKAQFLAQGMSWIQSKLQKKWLEKQDLAQNITHTQALELIQSSNTKINNLYEAFAQRLSPESDWSDKIEMSKSKPYQAIRALADTPTSCAEEDIFRILAVRCIIYKRWLFPARKILIEYKENAAKEMIPIIEELIQRTELIQETLDPDTQTFQHWLAKNIQQQFGQKQSKLNKFLTRLQ